MSVLGIVSVAATVWSCGPPAALPRHAMELESVGSSSTLRIGHTSFHFTRYTASGGE